MLNSIKRFYQKTKNSYTNKIQVRLTVSLILVSLLPIVIIGLVGSRMSINTVRGIVLDYITDEARLEVKEIEDVMSQLNYDILVISKLPQIPGLIRSIDYGGVDPRTGLTYPEFKESLDQFFISMVEYKNYYYQVRYIDESGMERVRVDFDEAKNKGVIVTEMQDKSDRDYYEEAMKLEKGEVYISPMNLNQEFGRIELPYQPVIRVASPVFDGADNRRGFVIVNVFGEYIFDLLDQDDTNSKFSPNFILVNQDGYFLDNPIDHNSEFGFDRGFETTANDWYPWLVGQLDNNGSALVENPVIRQIGSMEKITYNLENPDEYWYLITIFPLESVFAEANQLSRISLIIGFGTIILILFVSVGFSDAFTKPILALTNMAEKISEGDLEARIEVDKGDEIGQLANRFNQMASSIDEVQKQLAGILATANEGIITLDTKKEIIFYNRAAEKILGYTYEEMVGKTIDRLIPERSKMIHRAEMEKFSQWQGKSPREMGVSREVTGVHKNGEEMPLEASISRLEVNGKLFFTVIFRDITQRKQEEWEILESHNRQLETKNQALEEFNVLLKLSNRDLQDFAYIASHDLKEPLRKVQAFGDRLSERYKDQIDETGQDYIHRMQAATVRMQALIDGLLKFSRVTTQAQPFEPVDLNNTTADVIADLEQLIERTVAKVEVGQLPTVDGDPSQLYQLLQNLIANGIKFSAKGNIPHIEVSANLSANDCILTVKDNGIGFDEKYLDRIFKPFQRLHTRQEYEGTGMGLAITRRIVERHHGQITAKSEPGSGARFLVTLPLNQKVGIKIENRE